MLDKIRQLFIIEPTFAPRPTRRKARAGLFFWRASHAY